MSSAINSNNYIEKFLDYAIPLKRSAIQAAGRAGINYFFHNALRALSTASHFIHIFNPLQRREGGGFVDTFLFKRVQEIARRMGIKEEVQVTISERGASRVHGSRWICEITINAKDLLLSKNSLDFVIAHELSHYANRDHMNRLYLSGALLIADITASYFAGPFAIFLVEGALAESLMNFLSRNQEREADRRAVQVLGTKNGLVEFFSKRQRFLGEIREEEEMLWRESPEADVFDPYFRAVKIAVERFFPDVVVSKVSPSLDNRLDTEHPPYSERIALKN